MLHQVESQPPEVGRGGPSRPRWASPPLIPAGARGSRTPGRPDLSLEAMRALGTLFTLAALLLPSVRAQEGRALGRGSGGGFGHGFAVSPFSTTEKLKPGRACKEEHPSSLRVSLLLQRLPSPRPQAPPP